MSPHSLFECTSKIRNHGQVMLHVTNMTIFALWNVEHFCNCLTTLGIHILSMRKPEVRIQLALTH